MRPSRHMRQANQQTDLRHRAAPWLSADQARPLVTIFVLTLLMLTACSHTQSSATTPTPTFPAVPPSQVRIVTYATTVPAAEEGNYHLTASVSCQPGEQALGGGYILDDVFESDYQLEDSYPASTTTWTVSSTSGSHYDLQVLIYCVQAYPALGLTIVQAATCPAGRVLLSSGVHTGQSVALCAAHYVRAGATPNSFWLGAVEVQCAASSTGTTFSETRSFSFTCTWH